MVIKQISKDFWSLVSDDGEVRWTFYGQSRAEVLGRFLRRIRELDLDRVRYRPRDTVYSNGVEVIQDF